VYCAAFGQKLIQIEDGTDSKGTSPINPDKTLTLSSRVHTLQKENKLLWMIHTRLTSTVHDLQEGCRKNQSQWMRVMHLASSHPIEVEPCHSNHTEPGYRTRLTLIQEHHMEENEDLTASSEELKDRSVRLARQNEDLKADIALLEGAAGFWLQMGADMVNVQERFIQTAADCN
jgi:hypothetical protein